MKRWLHLLYTSSLPHRCIFLKELEGHRRCKASETWGAHRVTNLYRFTHYRRFTMHVFCNIESLVPFGASTLCFLSPRRLHPSETLGHWDHPTRFTFEQVHWSRCTSPLHFRCITLQFPHAVFLDRRCIALPRLRFALLPLR